MTDQTAAPRPVPTFADRTATDAPLPTWLPDALDELRATRAELERLRTALDRTNTDRQRLQSEIDVTDTAVVDTVRRLHRTEVDRDEALDARDVLRHRLDTAREDAYRDIARQIDILAADPGILRDWLTTCHPQPISFGELFHALAEKLRRPTPPPSVPSRRAQEG